MKLRVLGLSLAASVVVALAATSGASSSTVARAACPAPGSVSSYHVTSLYEHAIGCDHAKHLLIENLAHHRRHTYTCNHRISGRHVHMHCTDTGNSAHQYSATYYVH